MRRLFIVLWFAMILAFPAQIAAQNAQETWTGVVVDMNGEPIPGVAVFTTEGGGITDIDGAFSIKAKKGDNIQFSCLGFESVSIKAGSPDLKRVVLKDDMQILSRVSITGVWTRLHTNLWMYAKTFMTSWQMLLPISRTVRFMVSAWATLSTKI